MSDLYLKPTTDGGELVIENGKPQTTDALETSVYLSLFTSDYFGNAFSEKSEKVDSRLFEIMNSNPLTLQTKLDAIAEIKRVLQWMIDDNIASEILVRGEITQPGRLNIAITIQKPEIDDPAIYRYSLNWDAQEVSLT